MNMKVIAACFLISLLQLPVTAFAERPPQEECVQPSCAKPDINEDSDCGFAWRKYENCKANNQQNSSD